MRKANSLTDVSESTAKGTKRNGDNVERKKNLLNYNKDH